MSKNNLYLIATLIAMVLAALLISSKKAGPEETVQIAVPPSERASPMNGLSGGTTMRAVNQGASPMTNTGNPAGASTAESADTPPAPAPELDIPATAAGAPAASPPATTPSATSGK